MNLPACFSVTLALACVPGILTAQVAAVRPHPSALFGVASREATVPAADTLNLPRTYAKEGALIGGIPMLFVGGAMVGGLCRMDESTDGPNCTLATIGGALIGGGIGAITGALIGGSIERQGP